MNEDDRDRDALKVLYSESVLHAALAVVGLVLEGHPGPPGEGQQQPLQERKELGEEQVLPEGEHQLQEQQEQQGDNIVVVEQDENLPPSPPQQQQQKKMTQNTDEINSRKKQRTAARAMTDGQGLNQEAQGTKAGGGPAAAAAAAAPASIDLSDDKAVLQRARLLLLEGNSVLREHMIAKATSITVATSAMKEGKCRPMHSSVKGHDIWKSSKHSGGSFYAWHGSGLGNWHIILRTGLKNMSNTKHMSAGAAFGSGIYFANSLATSLGYSRKTDYGDRKSGFDDVGREANEQEASAAAGQQDPPKRYCTSAPRSGQRLVEEGVVCVALCEIINRPEDFTHADDNYKVVPQEEFVSTRYFFMFPIRYHADQALLATDMVTLDGAALP